MSDKTSTELDETLEKQLTEPYNVDSEAKLQRSFYVKKWIWDAANELPISRPEIITRALLNEIAAFKSEIPLLKYDVEQIDIQIESLHAQKTAKLNRIAELENQAVLNDTDAAFSEFAVQQAILETTELLKMVGYRDLQKVHYTRLQELSHTPAAEIKEFLKSKKFMPSDYEIEMFYRR